MNYTKGPKVSSLGSREIFNYGYFETLDIVEENIDTLLIKKRTLRIKYGGYNGTETNDGNLFAIQPDPSSETGEQIETMMNRKRHGKRPYKLKRRH